MRRAHSSVKRLEHFGPELMEASGLFLKHKHGQFSDRFAGRLMFPIENAAGDLVAFGARKLQDTDGPKYLNSRATEIYDKSSLLYNLRRAANAARETDPIVVVVLGNSEREGNSRPLICRFE